MAFSLNPMIEALENLYTFIIGEFQIIITNILFVARHISPDWGMRNSKCGIEEKIGGRHRVKV